MMIVCYRIHASGLWIKVNKYLSFFLLINVYYLLITSSAYAHKVNIYAYAEDGMVYSESYFVDGSRCKNSILEVFDEKKGTKLFEGRTDEEGRFSFKIPTVTSLKLVLNASMGHQAEYTIGEDEVRKAMGMKRSSQISSVKSPLKIEGVANTKNAFKKFPVEVSIQESKGLSKSDIETIVEGAIDKKLQPVVRMLVKMQEDKGKPRFTEIIGGIGYIIGIAGIIAYFKAKNEIRKRS